VPQTRDRRRPLAMLTTKRVGTCSGPFGPRSATQRKIHINCIVKELIPQRRDKTSPDIWPEMRCACRSALYANAPDQRT
jgi:hypothetical protein